MLIGHRKEFIKLTFRALSEGITKNLCSSALDSLYIVERFTYGTNGLDVGLMQLERKEELKYITPHFHSRMKLQNSAPSKGKLHCRTNRP